MWDTVVPFVVVFVLVLVAIVAVFFVGMRTGSRFVRDVVRRFNRAVGNPYQMRTAGTPGAYASVIRHVGRTTGRQYATPMVPFPTDDGFVIALPYGPGADWVKNVMASGSATIVHGGTTYRVGQPELVPVAEAAPYLPAKEQRSLRRFHVERCLLVHGVETEEDAAIAEEATVG
jgi:deazaflavin-dependent oxidoreductase (nitroreductase family)